MNESPSFTEVKDHIIHLADASQTCSRAYVLFHRSSSRRFSSGGYSKEMKCLKSHFIHICRFGAHKRKQTCSSIYVAGSVTLCVHYSLKSIWTNLTTTVVPGVGPKKQDSLPLPPGLGWAWLGGLWFFGGFYHDMLPNRSISWWGPDGGGTWTFPPCSGVPLLIRN